MNKFLPNSRGGEIPAGYSAPTAELVEVSVEKGFQYSPTAGSPDEFPEDNIWGALYLDEEGNPYFF